MQLVKIYLVDQLVEVLPWLAQSLDLSPIENLWNDSRKQIEVRKLNNHQELWDLIRIA